MRRRILLAILLAVAVTTCALGIPLGYTALQLVETLTREQLRVRVQQIALQLDNALANSKDPEISEVQPLVASGERLVVTLPASRTPTQTYGPDLGDDYL